MRINALDDRQTNLLVFHPKFKKKMFNYYKNALDMKRINKTRNTQTLQIINKIHD